MDDEAPAYIAIDLVSNNDTVTETDNGTDLSIAETSDEDYDSDEDNEVIAMMSDINEDSNGLPGLVASVAIENEFPPAATMNKNELERFMGREIAQGHVGAVRFEAGIKQIEDRAGHGIERGRSHPHRGRASALVVPAPVDGHRDKSAGRHLGCYY